MVRAQRIETVDALRGIAAVAVVWFHFTQGSTLLPDGWLKASGTHGWLGVEVFFVISGFIIPFSMHRSGYRFPSDAGVFILKRVVRLDPPYLVAIAIALLLLHASAATPWFQGAEPNTHPVHVLAHLAYLNAFLGYPWAIIVLWTLAIEFQFYLIMTVALPSLTHSLLRIRLLSVGLLCGSAFLIPNEALVFHYMGLFALGLLTFNRCAGLLPNRLYLFLLIPVLVITYASLGLTVALVGLFSALAIAFVRIPRFTWLAFLGSISYSLYLLHVPIGGRVLNIGVRFADSLPSQLAVLALAWLISIASAYLMWKWVERPAQGWAAAIKYKDRG